MTMECACGSAEVECQSYMGHDTLAQRVLGVPTLSEWGIIIFMILAGTWGHSSS